jgi:Flp pilus assembly pilin Flp
LLADERGTTAIEYALLASLVAILAIGGLQALSSSTGGLYATLQAISLAIQDALAS